MHTHTHTLTHSHIFAYKLAYINKHTHTHIYINIKLCLPQEMQSLPDFEYSFKFENVAGRKLNGQLPEVAGKSWQHMIDILINGVSTINLAISPKCCVIICFTFHTDAIVCITMFI